MFYLFHVLYRFAPTFGDAGDWEHANSHATIEGARAAAFAIMAQHVNDGLRSEVRVYGKGSIPNAIAHAENGSDFALDYAWQGAGEDGYYERTAL